MAKNYGNRYLANKIIKKLINKMSDNIKQWLITPLIEKITFNGENIDKYIQYDIINDSDEYRNAILGKTEIVLDQIDNLIDFIGPIIEIAKILGSKEKVGKMSKFLEYMSTFDYKGLIQISKNIYESIKITKVDINFDNSLSTIIKASNPSYSEKEIDNICKELIECGIINKDGQFDSKYIAIKGFKQAFDIKIDDKYMEYEYKEKKLTNELENNLNFIALKVSESVLNNKKLKIKDDIYEQLETFMESIIQRILDLLEDKVNEQFEKIWQKYKNKKAAENMEMENEEKKDKKQENEGNRENEENEEIQVSKKANQNQNNPEEENIVLPELNNEEIQKNKIKENNENNEDDCEKVKMSSNKKNNTSNENNDINDSEEIEISSKKKRINEN